MYVCVCCRGFSRLLFRLCLSLGREERGNTCQSRDDMWHVCVAILLITFHSFFRFNREQFNIINKIQDTIYSAVDVRFNFFHSRSQRLFVSYFWLIMRALTAHYVPRIFTNPIIRGFESLRENAFVKKTLFFSRNIVSAFHRIGTFTRFVMPTLRVTTPRKINAAARRSGRRHGNGDLFSA